MANVIVVSETPQRVIIRDEAATRTVKVVAQGPQGPSGNVNPLMFQLLDQATSAATSASADAAAAQSSSASAFASANAAGASAASVSASELAAEGSAVQAAASASQAGASAASVAASATSAQASATSAANSATSAQASADAVINKANIADAAAASATDSAATATTKATEAATSATNAANSATSASTSATTATTKATQASTSATLAQDWAIKTVDPVSGAEYSSKYHAQAASASAGSASSSANAAAASATTAGTKAGEASASAASALDSKDVASVAAQFAVNAQSAAQTSANAALASKNAAATSATSASDSATAASNSATAAAGSATSAGNSATGASSSAVAAAGSAATATTKASEASTSATNAAASATAAATSATNAATSATAAATSATNTANALVGERSAVATLTNKTITGGAVNPTTLQEGGVDAVIQSDIGTEPNQIPLNQYLGPLAYRDENPAGAVVGTTAVQVLSRKSFSDNVGIGTSSPVTALDVRAATGASIIAGRTSNTGAASEPGNFEVRAPNASGTEMIWNQINAVVNTATAGSEASSMLFKTRSGGVFAERMRIDASGNLGLGAVPSAWGSNYKALQINSGGAGVASTSRNLIVVGNAYNDNASWRYVAGAPASMYNCNGIAGQHEWHTAPSGTAGSPISFTRAMTLTSGGNLLVASTLDDRSHKIKVRGPSSGGVAAAGSDYCVAIYGPDEAAYLGFNINTISTVSANPLIFGTNNTERARIDSSGNLLVGRSTAASGGKLEVAGNMVCQPSVAAPTLGTNGDMSFQLVSNTSLKVLVRGSDGVTRSTTLTLA